MTIFPVIDLKGGVVVRGVAGQRQNYRPIQSRLCSSSTPGAVATALVNAFGLRQIYVADLDAIGGAEPDWDGYRAIADAGASLMLDAGLPDAQRASALMSHARADGWLAHVVIGLETLNCLDSLPPIAAAIGPQRAVFSLDLQGGRPLSANPSIRSQTPLALARAAVEAGFQHLVVLDLAGVGVGDGVHGLELCQEIRSAFPHVRLISGGGVRHLADLQALADCGCDGALVASALHDGRLTHEDLSTFS